MGRPSSSNRASSKRKISKLHSQARKKKNGTISKKLRRRKHYSSCSSDDSRSLTSISSSSSEGDHYRSRSHRKGESKGSKKRVRERSSTKRDKLLKIKKPHKKKRRQEPSVTSLSSDSRYCSANSVPSDTKKKFRKKRRKREPSIASITSDSRSSSSNSVPSNTKKKLKRKRHKREPSIASIASDSHSCSTCQGSFSSDEDRKVENRRERFSEKSKGVRDLGEIKSFKFRSRSCSPYDRYNDGIDSSMPIVAFENTSRRLRSVITVVKPSEDEENKWNQDSIKEKMVQDYPSCRSNDSIDGNNKLDLDHCSDGDVEARDVGILKRDEASLSDLKSTEVRRSGDGGINNTSNENKREVVSPVLPNSENDLESILRLKALENMIKYKGAQIEKLKAPTKLCSSSVTEQTCKPVTIKSEPSTISKNMQKANSVVAENIVNDNSAITSKNVRIASKHGEQGSKAPKSSISELGIIPEKAQHANLLVAEKSVANKAALTSKSVGQASKNGEQNIVLKSSISEPINNIPVKAQSGDLSLVESTVNNKVALTSVSSGQATKKDERDNVPKSSISEPCSSLKPILEENCLKEHQNAEKDGSQFEQKTMSVMRGGEMVEVSYKVYIPKKAPSLARRPLRR